MSKPKPQFKPSNVLLVEVPPQFIALCEASGASPHGENESACLDPDDVA